MKRLGLLAVGIALIAIASFVYAQDDDTAARRGAAVYAEFCQACHGPAGEGIAAGPAFQSVTYNPDTARDVIEHGIEAESDTDIAMAGYGPLLNDQQVDDLLAYMATWESGTTPPLPEPNIQVEVEDETSAASPQVGAVIYAKHCLGCHGREGAGQGKDVFPAFEVGNNTMMLITSGHESQYMPAFGEAYGGPLSDQALADLAAYMNTWEPRADTGPSAKGLDTLVILMGVAAILFVGAAYITQIGIRRG
jgi:mono/diheme cytochrome c family protein